MKPTSFVHIALISIAVLALANIDLTPRVAAHPPDTAAILLLEARLNALEEKLQFVTIETGPINGLAGPHMIITGANLHIRDGSGSTAGAPIGLGNFVVGYNEPSSPLPSGARGGTHNLIIGPQHTFTSFGGLVAGRSNTISGAYASVSGGRLNTASGTYASVSSGRNNEASNWWASVSGGADNTASYWYANVSGGYSNTASGTYASVSGGSGRTAAGSYDWRAGSLWENY